MFEVFVQAQSRTRYFAGQCPMKVYMLLSLSWLLSFLYSLNGQLGLLEEFVVMLNKYVEAKFIVTESPVQIGEMVTFPFEKLCLLVDWYTTSIYSSLAPSLFSVVFLLSLHSAGNVRL